MEDSYHVLVTGANGGLGLAICCRLLDEFLETRDGQITLIFTTRTVHKAEETKRLIGKHLDRRARACKDDLSRITVQSETVDLASLDSVRQLAVRLARSTLQLDAIILNAGMGGFTGLNWPLAVWQVFTDWITAVTWPSYKLSAIGSLTKPQMKHHTSAEAPLGEIFCANVFGHYLLVHWLAGLLSNPCSMQHRSRIIWVSSLEAVDESFSINDIQALRSTTPYESSKRLTEILALTSSLPSSKTYIESLLDIGSNNAQKPLYRPDQYLMHPGICATSIIPLHPILQWCMLMAFYIARWCGSPWHTITSYSGACAAVWLALSPIAILDSRDASDGKHKWGSATDLWGHDRIAETETDGWGYGGIVVKAIQSRRGRRRGAKDLTSEARTEFAQIGREAWRQMEDLRVEWEKRLVTP